MSHKATNWLSELPPDALKSSEFRVLFHLCDCHNPSRGCFPTQAYLRHRTNLSNGALNNALNALEANRLIARHVEMDQDTRRRKPTRYTLGFEMPEPGEPTPESGDGNGGEPSPENGDGAISSLEGEPSPVSGQSHLQPTGEEPVKEPVKNLARAHATPPVSPKNRFGEAARKTAKTYADRIREGVSIPASFINDEVAACLVADHAITKDQMRRAGLGHLL